MTAETTRTPDETIVAFRDAYEQAYFAVPAASRRDYEGHLEAHGEAIEAGLAAIGAIPDTRQQTGEASP